MSRSRNHAGGINRKDWTGIVQGRLTITSLCKPGTHYSTPRWNAICSCGNKHVLCSGSLRAGVKSCGCLTREATIRRNHIHGESDSPAMKSWANMIQRCTNPKNHKYARYGARGITVCDRWKTFKNFLQDMGQPPKGKTLDRINNDGNYEPGNCRWTDAYHQAANRSNNRNCTFLGKTQTASEWCRELNISYSMVRMRLHKGWSEQKAFFTPPRIW